MSDQNSLAGQFWRTYLSGAQFTSFPSSMKQRFTDTVASGTSSNTQKISIDGAVHDRVIVAAWAFVVSVHTLSEDIIFGLSIASNHGSAHDPVRTFPFRLQLPEMGLSTSELIENVQASLVQCLSYQNELRDYMAHRNASRTATGRFSSRVQVLTSTSEDGYRKRDGDFGSHNDAQLCPINVKCLKFPESVECWIEFDMTAHSPGVASAMLDHFNSAIRAMLGQSIPLVEVDLFGESDFQSVVGQWTPSPEPVSTQALLHTAVEEQARSNPHAVAIGQTERVMTYGELEKSATLLARHIATMATRTPEGRIGNIAVLFEKSPFAIVSMLAILKAGGAFVPIDIDWPEKRVQMVLSGASISTVLCSETEQAKLYSNSVTTITVSAQSLYDLKKNRSYTQNSDSGPPLTPTPSDAAYIIYTSGSTGRPKGIEISHRSITTSLNALSRKFNVQRCSRALQFSAFTFDVSVGDIWLTLSNGARLCLPTEEERFVLDGFIASERCNFALLTPSGAATINPLVAKRYLKSIFLIGEAPSTSLLHQLAPPHDGDLLSNTWGPTEACVICTASDPIRLKSDDTLCQSPRNIGKSIGCTMFLVSPRNSNHLSPAYSPGEIALVGHTLATSYYGDVEKTDEAFRKDLDWTRETRIRNQLGDEVMARAYLTGDIGRFSEEGDGSVIFMHRKGGYVKVNGFRIDPGEVEKAIADLRGDGVGANTKVLAFERNIQDERDRQARQSLVCFFAKSSKGSGPGSGCERLDIDQQTRSRLIHLVKSLKDSVPAYMVPELFVAVSEMPVSTSSKLDHKALLALLDSMSWDEIVEKYGVDHETHGAT